jgi:hypothetical protein
MGSFGQLVKQFILINFGSLAVHIGKLVKHFILINFGSLVVHNG